MKKYFLLAALSAVPAFAQVPATQPISPATQPIVPLGKLFRSRIAGIEFRPPAGGTLIRQLDTGEIVRFVYNDRGWDIRVKPVPLHKAMALTDLLDLTARQLVESNASAEIVTQKIANIGGRDVGLIEARYNAGADRLFTQQALIHNDDQSYFLILMGAPTSRSKNIPAETVDPRESEVRDAFTAMLPTVKLLDRVAVRQEQEHRLQNTRGLWLLMDKTKIAQAIIPLHFMRIVHDGKDVGFIQMNERLASHGGNPGVEIIVRSRVNEWHADSVQAGIVPMPAAVPVLGGVVLPKPIAAVSRAGAASKPTAAYSSSIFFFSFDRLSGFISSHEDWETLSQIDDQKGAQVTELGNSDLSERRILDLVRAASHVKSPGQDQQPPVIERPEYLLSVSQYQREHRLGRAFECELGSSYLPQGLGQILPRLLPYDSEQYMFGSYVSTEHNVLRRYVDVDPAIDVTLDGKTVHAIPVSDRIGVDGIPTIHYVTRSGEWLGSRNEESKLDVLPSDEDALKQIWPGFVISPEPPMPNDESPIAPRTPRHVEPAASQPPSQTLQPNGGDGR